MVSSWRPNVFDVCGIYCPRIDRKAGPLTKAGFCRTCS